MRPLDQPKHFNKVNISPPVSPVVLPLRLPEPEWAIATDEATARTDYTLEEHSRWRTRYNSLSPLWSQFAPGAFLDGLLNLSLDPSRIPRLVDINKLLIRQSGYRAFGQDTPLPMASHLAAIAHSRFPVARACPLHRPTKTVVPEAHDVIHDLAACLPWLSCQEYVVAWRTMGQIGLGIRLRLQKRPNRRDLARLTSAAGALKRVWWATFLRGTVTEGQEQKALGSHLLVDRDFLPKIPNFQSVRFDLATVIHAPLSTSVCYRLDSVAQLAGEMLDLERWLAAGRLDFIPSAPQDLSEEERHSFTIASSF